jgi:hypothetical protein
MSSLKHGNGSASFETIDEATLAKVAYDYYHIVRYNYVINYWPLKTSLASNH